MYYNNLQTNQSVSYDDQCLKEELRKIDQEYDQKVMMLREERRRNSEPGFGISCEKHRQYSCRCTYRPYRPGGIVDRVMNVIKNGMMVVDRALDNRIINFYASNVLKNKAPAVHVALETRNIHKACINGDFFTFLVSAYSGGKSINKMFSTNK